MNHLTILRKLTDVFTKNPNSNIGKLFLIVSEQFNELEESALKVENWRDIDQAEGTTLDAKGKERGQQRGQASDEIMRVLLKSRLARNNSDGTIDNVINALAVALRASPSTIRIKALWDEGQPAALMIDGLPIDALNRVGMSATEFGALAQAIVVSGMEITSIDLTGTFSFSDDYDNGQMDNAAGFADDAQTIGGTFSYVFDPSQDTDLPI